MIGICGCECRYPKRPAGGGCLQLELQMAVSCSVSAEDLTLVLCKSCLCPLFIKQTPLFL